MKTVIQKIYEHSLQRPDNTAVIFENCNISYGELWNRSVALSQQLKAAGVSRGDKVIVQCKYDPLFIISLFAIHLSKAIFIPVDKNPTEESIYALCEKLNAKVLISDLEIDPEGVELINYDRLNILSTSSCEKCSFDFPELKDVADIMFTTGTTGAPKGVELTHENISTTVEVRIAECRIKDNNTSITLVPLNHVAPLRELYLNLYNGSSVIFIDGMIRIKTMFEFMDKYSVSSMYIPPAGISLIMQLTKTKLCEYKDRLDYVYTGSAPMQEAQQEFMRSCLPNSRLFFSYGSSENGTVCLYRYDKYHNNICCCGKPCVGVDLKIVDENFNDVESGELGQIAIKSNMNMKGYYEMPELTSSVFKNGYFMSNDIGYIDEEGFLFVTGRKDDIINVGGLKVYPSEIENAALEIEGVADCVCFAIKDPITGQAAELLLRLSEGCSLSIKDIRNKLSSALDSYKIPKTIEFVEEIKRTSNGKLDRKFYTQK